MVWSRSYPFILGIAALLALSACGQEPVPEVEAETVPAAQSPTPAKPVTPAPVTELALGFAPIAFDLAGTSWLVIEIDGEPLADRYSDLATVHFTDTMLYWQACNHHEGLYVRTQGSFAAGAMTTTLAACPAESPDAEMARVLSGRPLIGSNAEEKLMLAVKGKTMTLSQIDARYKEMPAPPLEAGPFRLMVPDGGSRPPVLSFKGAKFSVWADCPGAITGTAAVRAGFMHTGKVALGQCDTHRPTAIAALKDFFAGSPAISRGPNGELLLSDGQTVIHGRQCYPDASPCGYAAGANIAGE